MLDCVKTLLEQTARQIENSKGRCAVADESIAEATAGLLLELNSELFARQPKDLLQDRTVSSVVMRSGRTR